MTFNSNGLIQYLILDSLSSGSKYGLEIIESISKRTNGGYILKKPTLYSCLTRLEKRGYISSSYWGESELGGKRHYYSLTKTGRENLSLNSNEFEQMLSDYKSGNFTSEEEKEPVVAQSSTTDNTTEEKPVYLEQKTLFEDAISSKKTQKEEQPQNQVIDNQIDLFSFASTVAAEEKKEEEERKDDAVFITDPIPEQSSTLTETQLEQNKKIYDTSSELKKYRSKKSFADNQIEIPVVYTDKQDEEDTKAKIAALKQSLLDAKQSYNTNNYYSNSTYTNVSQEQTEEREEENKPRPSFIDRIEEHRGEVYTRPTYYKQPEPLTETQPAKPSPDDAVFITASVDADKIQYQKRIAPPNIEISVSAENLPAPMRDSKLEPTYKDMVSKIMEKKKEKPAPQSELSDEIPEPAYKNAYADSSYVDGELNFVDYETLKNYYSTHGITFKEYRKTKVERIHNTNFLNFIASAILLLLSAVGSGLIYLITWACHLLMPATNFMYYTIIIAFAVFVAVEFILYKFTNSKKASLKYDAIVNWIIFLLSCVVILVVNVCFGMQVENFATFLTSMLVPAFAILLIFPINFHIRKFLYKKFAK